MAFEIAKAGWVFRQSSILRRWKRNWLVLYQSGDLKYFESQDSHTAEEAYRFGSECIAIQTSEQITGVDPPEGQSRKCLLTILLTGNRSLNICAESPDDASAWHISLEQARVVEHLPQQPGHLAGYPTQAQTVVYTHPAYHGHYGPHPPAYVVRGAPGQHTTIVYTDDPYRYRRRYDGTDVAMGVMAGAAMTSLMWGPLLWW